MYVCMNVKCVCKYGCLRSEEVVGCPRTWVGGGCELPVNGHWELNSVQEPLNHSPSFSHLSNIEKHILKLTFNHQVLFFSVQSTQQLVVSLKVCIVARFLAAFLFSFFLGTWGPSICDYVVTHLFESSGKAGKWQEQKSWRNLKLVS